ncbi:class I SAM-dependent methyltransferase [Bradyrhizobium lupini]|uniref:class I SAM-dependent methyltransferase n=1 Tax=Rhizobium lupini TaxID=136996 RepID=UPI0034C6A774
MSPWATFYEGRANASYLEYAKQRYRVFIDAICSRITAGDTVLELGAGTGTITAALEPIIELATLVATDIDPDQLATMSKRFEDTDILVQRLDATSGHAVTSADVVHSHGMLEHFDDETIRKVIDSYRGIAHSQVHYVPGLYPKPTFGDERLMPVERWWDIVKPSQIITFNDGLDYALVIE